ncbi:polysaccharide biosynthesis/export family protein [bacterium]|nr:polysaccharide biosynthesis/export family protein [bacterium]
MNPFRIHAAVLCLPLFASLWAQVNPSEQIWDKRGSVPKAIDFEELLQEGQIDREQYESLKRQRESKLREQMAEMEALEIAVNPETYRVGPGDIFSLNVWGAMEAQIPATVNPEGKLVIPTIGEFTVAGQTLSDVQRLVVGKSMQLYDKSTVTLTLEGLRRFRVHVVGEVLYPGTYMARAISRISEVINDAGGLTDWAWAGGVELRHPDGETDTFDLNAFEQSGILDKDLFVNGGDVVFVPPLRLSDSQVVVEGDFSVSGVYQILPDEDLLVFLRRVHALRRNIDIAKIQVIRTDGNSEPLYRVQPFASDTSLVRCPLRHGDRIVLPSNFVFVKGSVLSPGAYPYVKNLKAVDYAGMAGGDYRSGHIRGIKVYHVANQKTEKGLGVIVEPGDVVHVNVNNEEKLKNYIALISALSYLVLAAKATGIIGE